LVVVSVGFGVVVVSLGILVVSGASAPFAAPVPPSVIAVSPVGEDDTSIGVSVVDSDDGPHAYTIAATANSNNSFFIIKIFG
jgi:hypothetical protein